MAEKPERAAESGVRLLPKQENAPMHQHLLAITLVAHLELPALIVIILTPGAKAVPTIIPLLVGIASTEVLYVFRVLRDRTRAWAAAWITAIAWAGFILWDMFTTKLGLLHPVLVPTPESVFNVFATQYLTLLNNVASSLELLFFGALTALAAGVVCGLVVGWIPGMRDVVTPIARVLAPIPSVVFAPYLVALMPTFRSASAMVIFLGLFWPTLLNMIVRVSSIDRRVHRCSLSVLAVT